MATSASGGGTTPSSPTLTPAPVSAPIPPTPTPPTAAPPVRVAYTRYATAGDRDDRITSHALDIFYKVMAWAGGVAILGWVLFGGFQWGRATAPTSVPTVLQSAPTVQPATPPIQQPAPSWSSRDECERYYVLTLHEAPAGRCN